MAGSRHVYAQLHVSHSSNIQALPEFWEDKGSMACLSSQAWTACTRSHDKGSLIRGVQLVKAEANEWCQEGNGCRRRLQNVASAYLQANLGMLIG